MFRSYDHHQADHTILKLRRRIKTHIVGYHTRNRMQTPQIKWNAFGIMSRDTLIRVGI
jgi:hypothetical protein